MKSEAILVKNQIRTTIERMISVIPEETWNSAGFQKEVRDLKQMLDICDRLDDILKKIPGDREMSKGEAYEIQSRVMLLQNMLNKI